MGPGLFVAPMRARCRIPAKEILKRVALRSILRSMTDVCVTYFISASLTFFPLSAKMGKEWFIERKDDGMEQKYKMIALDLDGTLNNDAKEITPKTRAALLKVQAQGVTVVLASGRQAQVIVRMAELISG